MPCIIIFADSSTIYKIKRLLNLYLLPLVILIYFHSASLVKPTHSVGEPAMATENLPSEEEFELVEADSDSDDYETEWIDVEPGGSVIGEIRAVKPNCGKFDTTVIELARGLGDIVAMWSNSQIDRTLDAEYFGYRSVNSSSSTE